MTTTEIKSLMDKETWMTAQEAVENGFADDLLPQAKANDNVPSQNHFYQSLRAELADLKNIITGHRKPTIGNSAEKKQMNDRILEIENQLNRQEAAWLEKETTLKNKTDEIAHLRFENESLLQRLARLESQGISQTAPNDKEPLEKPTNPLWEAEAKQLAAMFSPLEKAMLNK